MSEPKLITGGGPDRRAAATALHGETFKTDPLIQYFLGSVPEAKREIYIPEFMGVLLKAGALNGAIFDEIWAPDSDRPSDPNHPPASSAVWVPPGRKVDSTRTIIPAGFLGLTWNVGCWGLKRIFLDYQRTADRAKKRYLVKPDGTKIESYYYMFFISTAAEQRKKGFSSKLIRAFQDKCTKENRAIWTESTTERSHRLYLSLGFKDVHSWVVGRGVVDENGVKKQDGTLKGVKLWAMLWQPENRVET